MGPDCAGDSFDHQQARLVGVDLSSAMISEARTAAVYDALHVGDLVEYMTGVCDWFRTVPGRNDGIREAESLI